MIITTIVPFHPCPKNNSNQTITGRQDPQMPPKSRYLTDPRWVPPKRITKIRDLTIASLCSNRKKLCLPNICLNLQELRSSWHSPPQKEEVSFVSRRVRTNETGPKQSEEGTPTANKPFAEQRRVDRMKSLPSDVRGECEKDQRGAEEQLQAVRRHWKKWKEGAQHSQPEKGGNEELGYSSFRKTKNREFVKNFLKSRYRTDHCSFRPYRKSGPEEARLEKELLQEHYFSPWRGRSDSDELE